MTTATSSERRWLRAVTRFLRHVLRIDALRAFAISVIALGVVVWVGADEPAGQAALVVIGTLVSYILLPEEPQRFWRVHANDLAETVPPSDLRSAGLETAKALALQAGGAVDPACATALWKDASERVVLAVSDPRRIVLDMDYRIAVTAEGSRQRVRAMMTSKRCWPGAGQVFFSFCSDVSALGAEFASPGSFSREIVEPEPDESLDDWEGRMAMYPVSLMVDGRNVESVAHETRVLPDGARAHRVLFDVSGSVITERYATLQLLSEFHQATEDPTFTVKFSTYFCIGSTQLSFEVDDPTAAISVNDFMLDPSLGTEFFHQYGLGSHRAVVQTRSHSVLHPGSGVVFTWEPGVLLAPIPPALESGLPEGDALPSPPTLPTVLVPSEDRGEPLVPIYGARCVDAYYRLGLIDSPRELRARREVVRRLNLARSQLPPGFDFVVLDGWRDPELQKLLVAHYSEVQGSVEGYVADPSSPVMRPPHVVGAALDLTLAYKGTALALGSLYDDFTPSAHLDAFEQSDSTIRRLRRLMARALVEAGFAPYPYEWWHWSYGDDVWASFTGQAALYDVIDGAVK
jgi:D-alanyl-D-alanine dipeptidase